MKQTFITFRPSKMKYTHGKGLCSSENIYNIEWQSTLTIVVKSFQKKGQYHMTIYQNLYTVHHCTLYSVHHRLRIKQMFQQGRLFSFHPTLFILPCINHTTETTPTVQIAVLNNSSLVCRHPYGRVDAHWSTVGAICLQRSMCRK